MINLFDNYIFDLFNSDISEMLDFGYTETDVYFARKIADEYGMITVDDDFGTIRSQIDYDNRLASNLQRQEINDTKTATDKANNRQARRDSNNDFTNYFETWLVLQTTYEIAIATADETYYNIVTNAEIAALAAIESAENNYNNSVGLLDAQFEEAMAVIDNGNNISTGHFNATATTSNTVNNVQQNGNNGNGTNQNSSGSGILNKIKGQIGKLWGWMVSTDGSITATERFDTMMPNNNLGSVPINPDNLVTKMRLQQQIRADEQIADYTNRTADGLQEIQIQLAMWPFGIIASGADDILRSAHSIRKWVMPTTKVIKSTSGMLSDDVIQGLRSGMKRIDLSNSKLKGEIFEEFLAKSLGGTRDIKLGSRQFDVQVGNILIEAKAGLTVAMKNFPKLKDDIMHHRSIAQKNGKEYIFISAEKLPRELKQFLKSNKIKFLELSE